MTMIAIASLKSASAHIADSYDDSTGRVATACGWEGVAVGVFQARIVSEGLALLGRDMCIPCARAIEKRAIEKREKL